MSKRGENIYKRKDGRWEGRCKVVPDGKTKYFYGSSYKALKEKMLKYKSCEEEKYDDLIKPPSFSNVCDEWLFFCKENVKESTYVKYFNTIHNHIKPFFKDFELVKMNSDIVNDFISVKKTSGNITNGMGLSQSSIRAMIKIIDNIMKFALSKKYILKPVLFEKLSLQPSKTKDSRVLSSAEQAVLQGYLLSENDNSKLGILLCLYTGMRIGEICALKWSNFNFKTRTISVEKTMQRIQNHSIEFKTKTRIIETLPKTRSSIREIPIPDFLLKYLLKYRKKDGNSYFLTGDTLKFTEPRCYENLFKKYIADCKIKNANFHSLRHTFATNCIEVGFDTKSLSEILGHSNVQITLNRYVHPTMETKRNNMNLLCSVCV